MIDAVNDTSTGQPGQPGTFNVSTNDKIPGGLDVHADGDDVCRRGR